MKYAWEQFLKQNRNCALSGEALRFQTKCKSSDGTASLDRIDSSHGYIGGNVQWVHKDINYMKMDLDNAKFIDWCRKVAQHSA